MKKAEKRSCAVRAASTVAEPVAAAKATSRPSVVQVLRERGLIQDVTNDTLEAVASKEALSVYCGFDPTAESLHLGNLLGIIVLSWFQRCGHQPVALLGGATGRVGDPSGRSLERPILSEEEIERNVAGIRRILEKLLTSADPTGPKPLLLNNLDWFGGMSFLGFLRDVGKYARVGTMLSRDAVKSRMEADGEGISFTEFTYQLLQGYDFVHLHRTHGVRVQVGGSDQFGNIVGGVDLMRKVPGATTTQQCFGLTFPLLTKSDGTKMGKSASGAVWLAADKLSPFKFYQYLLTSIPDSDVIKFLKMLTFLDLGEIARLEAAMQAPDYKPNLAQQVLAAEVTRFVHGEEGLQQALKTTQALAPGARTQLDADTLEAIAGEAPSASLAVEQVVECPLADVMVAAGLQPSKGAARRMIKGGGVAVNNAKVSDEMHKLTAADLIEGRLLLLAAGKKNKMLVRVQQS
ncbi:hypothetical protein WJX72_005856 [[Myrmecia] bisecta]|uniref:Tyrosine--tRNA ligase n=1 Tax=[Myrmecia] bisecta TaxID=41462 RepID=A0AAW1QFG3_9CHLO